MFYELFIDFKSLKKYLQYVLNFVDDLKMQQNEEVKKKKKLKIHGYIYMIICCFWLQNCLFFLEVQT